MADNNKPARKRPKNKTQPEPEPEEQPETKTEEQPETRQVWRNKTTGERVAIHNVTNTRTAFTYMDRVGHNGDSLTTEFLEHYEK